MIIERPMPTDSTEDAGTLYLKTNISPEQVFQAIGRLRKDARDEINRLIRFLDKTDDYVSRELEDDDDREEVGDSEPSLGSFDRVTNQEKSWRGNGVADLDAELDTADDEPALGSIDCHSPEHRSQEHWATGGRRDLELDDAESGIGDIDGVLEQVGTQDWQRGGMV